MKKFVEDDIDVKFDSPLHLVQSATCMLLTAPFKFVMAVSSKILYLPKEAQRKVVFNSAVVASVTTGLNFAFQMYFGCFSLWKGRMPLIAMAVVTAFLWFSEIVVTAHDFSFHSQLAHYLDGASEVSEDTGEEDTGVGSSDSSFNFREAAKAAMATAAATVASKVGQEQGQEQGQEEEKTPMQAQAVVNSETSGNLELGEPASIEDIDDIFDDDLVNEFAQEIAVESQTEEPVVAKGLDTSRLENSTWSVDYSAIDNSSKLLSEEEITQLEEKMKTCTDPSRFLSNKLLSRFNERQIIEDETNLDNLNLGIIPNSFRIFA